MKILTNYVLQGSDWASEEVRKIMRDRLSAPMREEVSEPERVERTNVIGNHLVASVQITLSSWLMYSSDTVSSIKPGYNSGLKIMLSELCYVCKLDFC